MRLIRPLVLSQPAVIAALAVAFFFTVGTALLGVASTRQVVSNNERIAHTHEVILGVQRLLTAITDVETGQRGYLLTRDEVYLQPYRDSDARIDPLLDSLRAKLGTDVQKQSSLATLVTLIASKRAEMAQTIALQSKGAHGAALNIVETDSGEKNMRQIRSLLNGLQAREMGELSDLSTRTAQRIQSFQVAGIALIGIAVVLAGVAGLLIARRVRELAHAFTVCAWTKRVRWKGKWVTFEEFLEQRFNLKFTHGISEEAAQKFSAEAFEAHQAGEQDSAPKAPG